MTAIWLAAGTAGAAVSGILLLSWLFPPQGEDYNKMFLGLGAAAVVVVCCVIASIYSAQLLLGWFHTGVISRPEAIAVVVGIALALSVLTLGYVVLRPQPVPWASAVGT